MVVATVLVVFPYVWESRFEKQAARIFTVVTEETFDIFQIVVVVAGALLVFLFVFKAVFICKGTNITSPVPQPFRAVAAYASFVRECSTYLAAKTKANKIITNAVWLHEATPVANKATKLSTAKKKELLGAQDGTHRNFILHGEKQEIVGGIFWTWSKMYDGTLFKEEGLWLSVRLVVIQFGQVVVAMCTVVFLCVSTELNAQSADEYRQELMEKRYPDYILDIFPTGHMIRSSFFPASLIAFLFMCFLIALYIPSSVATVLKYRNKLLPSLGSPYFERYRVSVDLTYMNTGNAWYGMFGSGFLFYLAIGGILFLFLWPITQKAAFQLMAWSIGLSITVGLKMLLTMACRTIQYRKYYRIRPHAAKLSSLALECWFLGLGGSVLIARVGQFLFAALFWVGRIDVPFLSDDVDLFGYTFDYAPAHYVKDLLVHEAHRHPYIERLSQMYLMKLRYGDDFVTAAGSAWRQLLISALMPWLVKYRVFSAERKEDAAIEAEEEEERIQEANRAFAGGIRTGFRRARRDMPEVGEDPADRGRDDVAVSGGNFGVALSELDYVGDEDDNDIDNEKGLNTVYES